MSTFFTRPPFLCVEMLSPADRMSGMQGRIGDYLSFGVRYVWVLDPQTRKAWIYTSDKIHEVRDGFLRTESPESYRSESNHASFWGYSATR